MGIAIVEQFAARWPGEQDGRDWRAGVMRDLGKPVDRFLEPRVVAMHEQQYMSFRRLQLEQALIEVGDRLFQIQPIRAHGDEVTRGIAGLRRRPLNVADLAHGVGRDRDGNVGELESRPRSPLNMTPGGSATSIRVVATNMSRVLAPGAVAETTMRFPLGRPAHPPSPTASKANAANAIILFI